MNTRVKAVAFLAALFLLACAALASNQKPDDKLFEAIAEVESHRNPQKINSGEDAVGYVQIRRVCVDDVNRIIGHKRYTYADRRSVEKSREIFDVYLTYYGDCLHRAGKNVTYRELSRVWQGGPKGNEKPETENYWHKVERELNK